MASSRAGGTALHWMPTRRKAIIANQASIDSFIRPVQRSRTGSRQTWSQRHQRLKASSARPPMVRGTTAVAKAWPAVLNQSV